MSQESMGATQGQGQLKIKKEGEIPTREPYKHLNIENKCRITVQLIYLKLYRNICEKKNKGQWDAKSSISW